MIKKYYVNQEMLDIAPISKCVVEAVLEFKPIQDLRNITISNVKQKDTDVFYRWFAFINQIPMYKMLPHMKSLRILPLNMEYDKEKEEIHIVISVTGSDKSIWNGKELDPMIKTEW